MNTPSMEDYLKAIYKVKVTGEVTAQDIARRIRVSAPAVSKMLKKLVHLKLVRIHPRTGIHLTPFGERTALQTIRRHRLIELYLVNELGYKWEEVHDEAERLEHYISPLLEERIAQKLGNPEFDPHGDPIPDSAGVMPIVEEFPLDHVTMPSKIIITRVPDQDPELLRYLKKLQFIPGEEVEFIGREPFGGSFQYKMKNTSAHIPQRVAEQVFGHVIEHQ
ncbi:MAG TPA: metal-dependent transcriptional regulator [Candidatus Kapabacteria bacterium]|nr:metal-dependent transcriptional regulator [Candidatus Kapabacteria bacterium]